MSHGAMQCVGTSQFLKTTYGAGYKLIFDRSDHMDQKKIESLTRYVQSHISEAHMLEQEGMENQVVYALPFHAVKKFGPFFTDLERDLSKHGVTNFGVNITSLEDVFLTVGEDESVTPHTQALVGIGGKKEGYNPNFFSQVVGIAYRRLNYAINDFTTIPLLLLPIGAISAASALYAEEVLSTLSEVNDLATAAIYAGGFIGAPGLIAEFIVRERANRLRNVLTVMGCDFKAYWIGTFIADYILLALPTAVMFISWFAGNLGHYYAGTGGISFLIILIFNAQLLGFSYFFSFVFTTPKSSLTFMPLLVLALLATPNVALLIVVQILISLDVTITIGLRGKQAHKFSQVS